MVAVQFFLKDTTDTSLCVQQHDLLSALPPFCGLNLVGTKINLPSPTPPPPMTEPTISGEVFEQHPLFLFSPTSQVSVPGQ